MEEKKGYLADYINDPIGAYEAIKKGIKFAGLDNTTIRDIVKKAITPWTNGFISPAQRQALLRLKKIDPEMINWFRAEYDKRHQNGESK